MIRSWLTLIIFMGYAIVGSGISQEQLSNAMDGAIENVKVQMEERQTQSNNFYLQKFVTNLGISMGFWIASLVYLGGYIYHLFPLPEILFLPLAIYFMLDALVFGFISALMAKSLFAGFFLVIEKTGLIRWGEKLESRRQN